MHLRINSGVTLGAAAFALISYGLVGCGGGGGGAPIVSKYKAQIAWPDRARTVSAPSSALSAKIEVLGSSTGGTLISWVANRGTNAAAHTETYSSTTGGTTGSHHVTVTFYASADATGTVLGSASFTQNIGAQGEITSPVTVGSTVKSVVVQPDQTVTAPGTKALDAVAKDDGGNVVALEAGSFFFAVTAGGDFLKIENGLAKGISQGEATVTARVDGMTSPAVAVHVASSAHYREIGTLRGGNDGKVDLNGISGDGTTLVGSAFVNSNGDFGNKPYRWTEAGGFQELEIGLTTPNTGISTRCSTDGSIVVGYTPGDITVGWIWNDGSVKWIRPLLSGNYTVCTDVTDDGKYAVGTLTTVSGNRGFRWQKNGNYTLVFDEVDVAASSVAACSNDGTVIVGERSMTASPDAPHLVIRNGDNPTTEIAFPAGVTAMHPFGCSSNGSVVVGAAVTAGGVWRPFRWAVDTGTTVFAEGNLAATCNADGSIVVGNDGINTFVWTTADGYQSLNAYALKTLGLTIAKQPKLGALISDNGKTIAGGVNPSEDAYEKSWIVAKN